MEKLLTELDNISQSTSTSIKRSKTQITINDEHLQSLQKNFASATIVIPLIGSIFAIALLPYWNIGVLEVGLLVSMYFLTFVGITVGFHRHFAHKAFETKLVIRIILTILGSMAAQGPLINWVATHRRHHQYSDQPGDPHSPYMNEEQRLNRWQGLWHSHLGWLMNSKMTNSTLFAKDLLREPIVVKINRLYLLWVVLGLAIPAFIEGIFTWSWIGAVKGLLWGGFFRLFLVHHFSWYIGSLAHIWGSRPFNTHEYSRNNIWTAIPTCGESWHNNHHAFPNSAMFGLKWWQIDIGAWNIRILEKVGLIWNVKVPTPEMVQAKNKTTIGNDERK